MAPTNDTPDDGARWDDGPLAVEVLSARAGIATGVALRCAGALLLVDCGDGIARDLADRRVPVDELLAVVLTHDHGDHVGGLAGLLWWQRLGRRAAPLALWRPAASPLAAGLVAAFRDALGERLRLVLEDHVLVHERPFAAGPFGIRTFPVRHRSASRSHDLMEVHALSIEAAGRRVVISSDTGPCERLECEADGADLAVLEATLPAGAESDPDTHLTLDHAAAVGARAKAWIAYHRPAR